MSKETEFMNVQTPDVFATRGLAEITSPVIRAEKMALSELELEKLHKINEVLNHPELDQLISEGKITLGMIKPRADDGKNLSADDQIAADTLVEEIGDQNIIFSLPIMMSPEDVAKFYEGNPHLDKIQKHFERGAVTFIFLYKKEGDAVAWWRERMGNTYPEKAKPGTIRKDFAYDVSNNLVHGSDSVESVKREVKILRKITTEMEEKSIKVRDSFPSESEFALNPGERLLAIEKTCAPRRKLPNFVGVIYRDDHIQKRPPEKQLSKAS